MNDKPRLIDAEAYKKSLNEEAAFRVLKVDSVAEARGILLAERILSAAPTIDAVPVVRCKGCGYSYQDERVKYMGKYWCGCHGQLRCPDDYCNEGYGKEASHD